MFPHPKEKDICKKFYNQVIQLQSYNFFKFPFLIFHVPNEQFTSKYYTLELKRMGLKSGVPDYAVIYHQSIAFIEFKRNEKCKLTENQQKFAKQCNNFQIPFLKTHDPEEAIEWIQALPKDMEPPSIVS